MSTLNHSLSKDSNIQPAIKNNYLQGLQDKADVISYLSEMTIIISHTNDIIHKRINENV